MGIKGAPSKVKAFIKGSLCRIKVTEGALSKVYVIVRGFPCRVKVI